MKATHKNTIRQGTTKSNIQYPSSSALGIPDMLSQNFSLNNQKLKSYKHRTPNISKDICHFYLDDYQLETVWNRDEVARNRVLKYYATLSPDFSIYQNWTKVINQYQTYRNRWITRNWQEAGMKVIPTLNWADKDSYEYCFEGILKSQIVSISISDLRNKDTERLFFNGLEELQKRLNPSLIICYGEININKYVDNKIEYHKTDWNNMRERINAKSKSKS